jgi:uridylate kinase
MKSIVIDIGGSVILSDDLDHVYFDNLKKLMDETIKKYKVFIVVGGGKTARSYIQFARKLKFDEKVLDQIGIDVTRINARIMLNVLSNSNKTIPVSTDEAKNMNYPIVVMGGTVPGHSTDAVAAELAEKVNAEKFIIATNVDGIYDKDPNKFKDARQLKEVFIKDLINKYGTNWNSAGKNIVIDGPALTIINDANLKTYVLNGKKIKELERAINNQKFNGTIVKK